MKQLAAVAATLLASSVAFAQPGPDQAYDAEPLPPVAQAQISGTVTVTPLPAQAAVAVNAAPMTDPWGNVSHINGQVVPVGERGAYLMSQKKFNISTNPIGWMFGFYGVSGSYALSQNIAIKADANVFSFDDESGYEYSVSLPIYFKRTYSGPFLEPGLVTRGMDDMDCYDCTSTPLAGPMVMVGWHSTFDSGLNIAAAVGAARNMNQVGEYEAKAEPVGYFRVGYAF